MIRASGVPSSRKRRVVSLRLDRDRVEVTGTSLGRPRQERTSIPDGSDPYEAVETVLRTSRLLRPGRACKLDVVVESARTVYRTVGEAVGTSWSEDSRHIEVVLPDGLVDVLIPILARRRVHGSTGVIPGPVVRALRTMRSRLEAGTPGRGLIIDRSSAAVTVLIAGPAEIPWARGGPADDPVLSVELLVERAAGPISAGPRLDWWHLEDVARAGDGPDREREAKGFEAACHALVGHLPRIPVAP